MAKTFRLIDDRQMEKLKPPPQLIPKILSCGAFAVLFGAPGSGKSFVALDLALSVATGRKWLRLKRFPVRRGSVVYVVAEGAGGFPKRLRAWKNHREYVRRADIHFLCEAVNLASLPEVKALIAAINAIEVKPVLVVLDTLARCLPGSDESSAKDMGKLVLGVDLIRQQTGAAVLLVHHTGKDVGAEERGSSALPGAVDTRISLRSGKSGLRLTCKKQKDDQEFKPIALELHRIELKDGTTSCVVRYKGADRASAEAELSPQHKKALGILRAFGKPVTHGAWKTDALRAGISAATFGRALKVLLASKLVTQEGKRYASKVLLSTKKQGLKSHNGLKQVS